jgi:hypothetical protein
MSKLAAKNLAKYRSGRLEFWLRVSFGPGAGSVNVGAGGATFDVANGGVLNVYPTPRAVDWHFLIGCF